MKVKLISAPTNALLNIASAAAITRGVTFEEVKGWTREKQEALVKQCYESGHWSVFEFADFDFEVQGVSRVFEAQAIRSRMASFEWQTGRKEREYFLADILENNPVVAEEAENALLEFQDILRTCPVKPEDARYMLPQGIAQKGRIKRNFRNLMETSHIRLCTKAQSEYRQFMQECKKLVTEVDPFLGSLLVPKCGWYGYCNEVKGCGLAPDKATVLRSWKQDTLSFERR